MKKLIVISLAVMVLMTIAFGLTAMASEDDPETSEPKDYARLIQEIPENADVETAITVEKRNNKHISAMQVLFDADSLKAYNQACSTMKKEDSARGRFAGHTYEQQPQLMQSCK